MNFVACVSYLSHITTIDETKDGVLLQSNTLIDGAKMKVLHANVTNRSEKYSSLYLTPIKIFLKDRRKVAQIQTNKTDSMAKLAYFCPSLGHLPAKL